jgi:hypothetical protein
MLEQLQFLGSIYVASEVAGALASWEGTDCFSARKPKSAIFRASAHH